MFTHKISLVGSARCADRTPQRGVPTSFVFGRAALLRGPNFSTKAERQLGPTDFVFGQTKSPNSWREGADKTCALLSFFPDTRRGWIWHLVVELALQPVAVASAGQSLSHSA
jgi:hypothetical protein